VTVDQARRGSSCGRDEAASAPSRLLNGTGTLAQLNLLLAQLNQLLGLLG
jgi:hypothetical protein